ncbi:DUF6461 domain-containing protein [Herbidospora cretacea]|uniref:DUF6461 domain-containing protein n=1 Tax=Herbidospora cretacea TaxID=28444 RepID=UPI0004C4608B|nr:DUF6461 domain-containing protein [Herbidospora cretacea]
MTDVYHHYRKLLGGSWMEVAICWTVVVPHDGRPLTLAEIGERVSGGEGFKAYGPEVFEDDEDCLVYSDDFEWAMLVDHSGPVTAILEYNGFKGVHDPVLPRLSVGGRAYSAYWNVNANNRLSFAADGEMVLSFDGMYIEEVIDQPELSRWPELLTMAPKFNWRKGQSWRAAMLSAIEMATGARLTEEWVTAGRSFLTSPEITLDLPED